MTAERTYRGGAATPERLEAVGPLQLDGQEAVWAVPDDGFDYSDGTQTEAAIYQAIKATPDRSVFSPGLRDQIHDWPTEYHFSCRRGNLLRHLGLGPGQAVLELGAGCGAVTRFLGETGASVTAVEGSLARARCAAARCAGMENVSVHCGRFECFVPRPRFDVVLLIGVLEYAPRFYPGPDPLLQCLNFARRWLKPGGELLLAIENQLGLKYLLGAEEDHHGKPYHGVADRYRRREAVTLGRRELSEQLTAAGFGGQRFAFPFPDYKLPVALVTEAGFATRAFDPSDLLRHLPAWSQHQQRPQLPFDMRRSWPVLLRNGITADLSNAFLVQAKADPYAADPRGDLAYAYAADRAAAYATSTRFFRPTATGPVEVDKLRMVPSGLVSAPVSTPASAGTLTHAVTRAAYLPGRLLETDVADAIDHRDAAGLMAGLQDWKAYLLQNATETPAAGPAAIGRPETIDWIPRNLIRGDGGDLAVIDQEWSLNEPFSLNTLMLRYLTLIAPGLRWARSAGGGGAFELREVARTLGLDVGPTAIAELEKIDDRLRSRVTPWLPPLRGERFFGPPSVELQSR